MTDDREFWRATSDWLDVGSDRTPPPAIDAVLLAVRTTRQDRVLPLPRLPFNVPVIARVALVAAALLGLALAVNLILVAGRRQAPPPTPVAVTDNSDNGTFFTNGERYVTPDEFPVRITFSGLDGWEGNVGGPNAVWIGPKLGDQPVLFNVNIDTYKDPCHSDLGTTNTPRTAAGVVDALDALPFVDVTDPAATMGGRPATLLTATAPGSLAGCTAGEWDLWNLPLGAYVYVPAGGTQLIWVVDMGTAGPLVIGAEDHPDWPPQMRAQIDQLLSSLRIEPSS
jgi:hypothetical protein